MARPLLLVLLALAVAAPTAAAVRIVEPFRLERYAASGAIGLSVPGAGPTVTRASALHTLLTGKVESSLLGGASGGTPLIELGAGPPPHTLVVLPPPGRSENDRYPIAVTIGIVAACFAGPYPAIKHNATAAITVNSATPYG